MPLFRPRESLHERLAREGGLSLGPVGEPSPPGWMETGIHGVPRAREWDAVAAVEAEGVTGDRVRFVALKDDTFLVEEGEGVEPLAIAIDKLASLPYRAEATRRTETQWAVGIREIEVVELAEDPGGDEVTLTVHDGRQELLVDGAHEYAMVPELQARGELAGPSYVVRAQRLDSSLWEVDVLRL